MAYRNQRIRVTRPFYMGGEALGAGSVVDVELPVAFELRNARKAEFADASEKVAKLPPAAKSSTRRSSRELQSNSSLLVSSLGEQVAQLTAQVKALSAKPAKEKVNA